MSGSQKYTIEEVKKYFEDHNCILLSTEYKNNRTKLDYICSCGNKSKIIFDSFKRGCRCNNCGYKRSHSKLKLTIEYIRKKFEESGCILLSTVYENNKTKLDYTCSNGHKTQITWNAFQKGRRCIKCRNKRTGDRFRFSFKQKREAFEKERCILLSEEKVNGINYLNYICSCGNKSQITWGNFQNGHRCYECGRKKTINARRLDYKLIQKTFEKEGCKLLSKTYVNNFTPLNFKCSCGNIEKITWAKFRSGSRCSHCRRKQSRGERKIHSILKSKNIAYIAEYSKTVCVNERAIPFDFAIKKDNTIYGLIEYDGIQHFKPIEFFGGYENFKETQKHDQIKNEYCKKNNIPLLRIPYTEFNSIENIINPFLNEIGVI